MRSDMGKVLTERPRNHGKAYGYKIVRRRDKHVWRADEDAAGGAQGIRRPHREHGDWKYFSDLLGPLYRFLHSRVGKPWNKVHSEICANLKGRSTTQQHILDHLKRMVDTKLSWDKEERVLREANGERYYGWRHSFYVDPRNGLLSYHKENHPRFKSDRRKIEEAMDEMKTKDGQVFRRVDGIWYEITVETEDHYGDGGSGESVAYQVNTEKKRQLGTEELRKRGLANADGP